MPTPFARTSSATDAAELHSFHQSSALEPSAERGRRVPAPSPLALTTAAALVVVAVVKAYLAWKLAMPPMYAMSAVAALIAAAIASGVRGARTAGAIYPTLLLALLLQFILPDLAHPETPTFTPSLLRVAGCALAVATGIAGIIEQRALRRYPGTRPRSAPRWLAPLTTAVAAACLGGASVAGIVRAGPAPMGLSASMMAALPSVTTQGYEFAQREIHVRAGQPAMLRVDNRDGAMHSFDLDAFDVHVPLPGQASTVVTFIAGSAGRHLVYCAPHFDRKSGQGMHTTLVVDP
jgi:plastocyanin